MAAPGTKSPKEAREPKKQTPTFLLELPLVVGPAQAKRLRAHLEAGRQLYNALLSEGQRRLRQMRADPAWQAARAIPHSRKQERQAAFSALREQYGFSEYGLHQAATRLRSGWIAEHLDAVLAQTLATRAYRALNRVCLGKAKRVRFKSRSRGLASLENKRNDTGLRFVLHKPEEGHQGVLIWKEDRMRVLIDWKDPVVTYGLAHRIKYARLIRRPVSSPNAQGADCQGYRYFVQLVLEGLPYHKPKHTVGADTIGLDLGPSSMAIVPQQAEARLEVLGGELIPDERAMRRLQRKMDRQLRAANPEHYDEKGRPSREASGGETSNGARATRPPDGRKPHENASSKRIARACMDARSMRLSHWARRSAPKRSPTKAGRNATAKVWAFGLQGC